MPLNLVKGRFRILRSQPDGDSIQFYPSDRAAFTKLHLPARANHKGGVQLRLDAIDALETHYAAPHGAVMQHQPLGLAHEAADALLEFLGFAAFTRDEETITASAPAQTAGYILTRFADTHGRPVALVFPGDQEGRDLRSVRVDVEMLQASANYQLIAIGAAYPTYYSRLYPDLRNALTTVADQARTNRLGVWARDATTTGATIAQLADLTDTLVVLPKLFRRLCDYLAINAGSADLAGFKSFLSARPDRLFIIPDGHVTDFETVVDVSGQTVRLTRSPQNLIFLEA
jgi:hypothetical protein